jgi:Lactonase, 7-bladed beta-propeller
MPVQGTVPNYLRLVLFAGAAADGNLRCTYRSFCATLRTGKSSNVVIRVGELTPGCNAMNVGRCALWFLLVLGISALLSCGGASSPIAPPNPTSEILYVLNNGSTTTYSIDPGSLNATQAEQPVDLVAPPASMLQFDPAPYDHFVYNVWSDGQNVQHLSIFQTDSSGVPQLPAIQTLDADSLSQFNMRPGGGFAYMLEVTSANNQYYAKIRLFNVVPGGKLKENPHLQGTYGPSPFWPALLYGFSPDGTKLYDTSTLATGSVYRERLINKANGTLGTDSQLISLNSNEDVAIGAVIAVQHQNVSNPNQGYLDIYPNTPNPKRAIHCTMAMLAYCASATNIQLDRTGRFLFLTDPATGAIHVASMSSSNQRIVDTGNSMPMTSQTPGYAFNQNGRIVYAMQTDGNVHFFHFDAATGALTEAGTPLPIAQGSGICPAHYQ